MKLVGGLVFLAALSSADIIQTDPSAQSDVDANPFAQFMSQAGGPASGYLDPSNPHCTTLNMVSDVNSTHVAGQYATKQFVMNAKDLCTQGLSYSSCEPLVDLIRQMIQAGLTITEKTDTATPDGQMIADVLRGSASPDVEIDNKTAIYQQVLLNPLPTNDNTVPIAVQALAYQSENITMFSLHAIPQVNTSAVAPSSKFKQGFKISFESTFNQMASSSSDYDSLSQTVAHQWYTAVTNLNISNYFGYVKSHGIPRVEFRIEPVENGFDFRNQSIQLCGPLGRTAVSSSNSTLANSNMNSSSVANGSPTASSPSVSSSSVPTNSLISASSSPSASASKESHGIPSLSHLDVTLFCTILFITTIASL